MGTYIVGDLQGCFDELQDLLEDINFDRSQDRLVLAGDVVNRGPKSLDCLRFARSLGESGVTVLGNHDLHLLAASLGAREVRRTDTLNQILEAPDCAELLQWLITRPVLVELEELNLVVVHAGLPPHWSVAEAREHGAELEQVLRSNRQSDFLHNMYGNEPCQWSHKYVGNDRLRYITNALTRTRYVDSEGRLDMHYAGPPGTQPPHLIPWFAHPDRHNRSHVIAFGHWATLQVEKPLSPEHGVIHLDTGCVWGGALSAVRAEDKRLFQVPSRQPDRTTRLQS